MPGGRPPRFKNPKDMEVLIDKYFVDCPDYRQVVNEGIVTRVPCPTISGMCLYLGFCDRHAMWEYEKKPEFSAAIKKAREKIRGVYEAMLHSSSPTGAIFALKNLGYSDRQPGEEGGSVVNQTITVIYGAVPKAVKGQQGSSAVADIQRFDQPVAA